MPGQFSAMDVSASGLRAERMRMEVTANNIANANTTRTANGDPYRKQSVVFSSVMDSHSSRYTAGSDLSGVEIVGVEPDPSEFPEVYIPGHPHADDNGLVRLSNVKIPTEMVDLITASRAYEANLKAITLFKDMVEQSLTMLQSTR